MPKYDLSMGVIMTPLRPKYGVLHLRLARVKLDFGIFVIQLNEKWGQNVFIICIYRTLSLNASFLLVERTSIYYL